MPKLTGSAERTFVDQILQVAGRGRARGSGDPEILVGAEAALETAGAFPKHTGDGLGLSVVQVVSVTITETGLADEKAEASMKYVV